MRFHFAALALIPLALAAEERSGTHPEFQWEGDVNDVCVLKVHQNQVEATDGDGNPIAHARHRFWSKLPDTNQSVRLQLLHGRGVARLVSQPQLENDYTATIRIEDPQPGASHYSVALRWAVSSYDQAGKSPKMKNAGEASDTPTVQRGATWFGHVDGTVRVSMRGNSSYSQIVSGMLTGERAEIAQALPQRSDLKYSLSKLSGGGDVKVVEPPSEANGYTLTFEIRNGDSTNSDYSVDIGWGAR